MSTNSECLFVQVKRDEWFYVLEDYNAPKNSWDWREHATGYGPFATEELAEDHLRNHHANPGGSCTERLAVGDVELDLSKDTVLQKLIEEARKNSKTRQSGWGMRSNFWR